MQSTFRVLLKKQFREQFLFAGRDRKNFDFLGTLLSLVLAVGVIAVVCYVFVTFADMYLGVKINRVPDLKERAFELLSAVYSIIFLINVLGGVKTINNSIFNSDDLKILIYMPIKSTALYATKMLTAYLKQFLTALITILPINFSLAALTPVGWYYWVMTAVILILLPLISLALGSLIALPVYYIKRAVSSRYVITLILATAITGIVFWGYSAILEFIKNLITTGDVRFFFNAEVMTKIGDATSILYPASFFANMLVGRNLLQGFLWTVGITVVSAALGLIVSKKLLIPAAQNRIAGGSRYVFRSKRVGMSGSVTATLLRKEFMTVLRTPSYAFQYFSTAIIMPLMVYFCMSIFSRLVNTLVLVDCNLELAIFLIIMFGVLTNTFCATNISRDGEIFYVMKTMPLGHRTIVKAKVLFCFIVSALSITVSATLIAALGYISAGECVFVIAVTVLISSAQICYATRKDFNRPRFSKEEDGEIKESNSTVSVLILLGLAISFVIGALALYSGLYLKLQHGADFGEMISMTVVSAIAVVLFGLSLFYLLFGLDRKYYKLCEGSV